MRKCCCLSAHEIGLKSRFLVGIQREEMRVNCNRSSHARKPKYEKLCVRCSYNGFSIFSFTKYLVIYLHNVQGFNVISKLKETNTVHTMQMQTSINKIYMGCTYYVFRLSLHIDRTKVYPFNTCEFHEEFVKTFKGVKTYFCKNNQQV